MRVVFVSLVLALTVFGCDDAGDDGNGMGGSGTGGSGTGGSGTGGSVVGGVEGMGGMVAQTCSPAVDLLFVVDNSGSMCEEQDALADAIGELDGFLAGLQADWRMAVVSTDMQSDAAGRFGVYTAEAVPSLNCQGRDNAPFVPNTADCEAGDEPVFLSASDVADAEERARKLRCRLIIGTQGHGFEKGLEAMRTSLSCTGPNRATFEGCCTDDGFDPSCPGGQPEFLRPGAALVVVFVTDENDCSDGSDNPMPQTTNDGCEWNRDQLAPVADYVTFLRTLKGSDDLVTVSTIAGAPNLNAMGQPYRFDSPDGAATPACEEGEDATPILTDACCPEGQCVGNVAPTCEGAFGNAFDGYRYFELASHFSVPEAACSDPNAMTCPTLCREGGFTNAFGQINTRLSALVPADCGGDEGDGG